MDHRVHQKESKLLGVQEKRRRTRKSKEAKQLGQSDHIRKDQNTEKIVDIEGNNLKKTENKKDYENEIREHQEFENTTIGGT